ncbi:hypothetical protein HID58_056133 [Brassica napus]|uniref:t-SNARE coiled-coil homology domain-containing protein n=1 Tax=Brassica napus TaxID=3708 RepID=A0ABQ8AMC3_BRANA|nr:hypothetical protein HID58_056133 [Brassica napus]
MASNPHRGGPGGSLYGGAAPYRSKDGLSTRTATGSEEIQLRIDPMHSDLDDEITGLHGQVRQLKNIAQDIGSEAKFQRDFLDELQVTLMRAQAGVKNNIRKLNLSIIRSGNNHIMHVIRKDLGRKEIRKKNFNGFLIHLRCSFGFVAFMSSFFIKREDWRPFRLAFSQHRLETGSVFSELFSFSFSFFSAAPLLVSLFISFPRIFIFRILGIEKVVMVNPILGLSVAFDLSSGTSGGLDSQKRRGLVVRAGKAALCQTKRSRSRKSLARTHGFRLRMRTTSGRATIKRRRAKGRWNLCPKSNPSSGKRA